MKTKNETTGKKAASIAGRWLRKLKTWKCPEDGEVLADRPSTGTVDDLIVPLGSVEELKTVLASCLTQSPDRKPAKAKKVK